MNKEIKYSGLSARPSDYDCPDGDLSIALNLLQEGQGALHPLSAPHVLASFGSKRPVFLHKAAGAVNLIIAESLESATNLCFCDYSKIESTAIVMQQFLSFSGSLLSITAIGNTLVVATSAGLEYCLFKDGGYVPLGSRPPFVSISFGMVMKGRLEDSDTSTIPDCPRYTANLFTNASGGGHGLIGASYETPADKATLDSISNAVLGLLLSKVADKVTTKGYFYQPFFIRYAFRLFDGSYAWHSAPILMLPDVHVPRVQLTKVSLDKDTLSLESTLRVPYFAISKRVKADGLANLEKWSDIVSSLDVFVSAPIYTYSQSERVRGWILLSNIYGRTGASGAHRVSSAPEYAFVGHFASALSAPAQDFNVKVADYEKYRCWDIAPAEKFEDAIADCSQFYFYRSIPLKDLKQDSSPVLFEPESEDLTSLVTRHALPDDWQSHFTLLPRFVTVYNSRLHLCGMSVRLPDPFPISSVAAASGTDAQHSSVQIRVWSRRNGGKCSVLSNPHGSSDLFPLGSELPRYIYYPDPSAYMMMLQSGSKTVIVELKPHPMLNGAYFFLGLGANPSVANAVPDSVSLPDSSPVLSKVYVSDATNPMAFPPEGIVTVGNGEVLALSSAAKALSQGQFGQFPLYAFTSEGVWALEVSASGAYSARQPVTRDVCIDPHAITQIDSAVLFPSSRGIMLLSGSQAQCISDAIDSETEFKASSLPGLDQACASAGAGIDGAFPVVPFIDFIKSCGMVYDYSHQRIIIYNAGHSYAYVFSLKSKMWGMMLSSLSATVNSYPEPLAVDKEGNLLDLSREESVLPGLLVSRPLKLGEADILKTVDTLIQRGHFRKGHVKSILYASRDLFNWSVVGSSVSHRLVNRLGTPYKYFRIVLVCALADDESISGSTVRYAPRFTRRVR